MTKRKYPVGIQSFESIRRDGYVYIDKTPLIYKMITEGMPYFLSRPRRFGKSLLCSTLAAVFEGRRDLFEAFTTEQGIEQPQLYIAQTDWRWEKYPVLRFDFSAGDLSTIEQLDELTDFFLSGYERQYGIMSGTKNANIRMANLMRTAHEQTGRRVVVICDEYDSMMLHSIGDDEKVTTIRQRFQNLFGPLKSEDDHLQFAFITGISKFSQMGVFSKLNQLDNISMQANYETICGISEQELLTTLRPDIELLAEKRGETFDATLGELKRMYDGYHFSEPMTDVYNPFSLIKAFNTGEIKDYWFDSATPSSLIHMLSQMPPLDFTELEGVPCNVRLFDLSFNNFRQPLPVLYQSGYLTIKNYDRDMEEYILGFPNKEVRTGFADCLYQHITKSQGEDDEDKRVFLRAYKVFRRDGELPPFIQALQTFFAGMPYQLDNANERHYHALLYTLLVSFGADVVAEEVTAKGRADIVLRMPKGIYVMELKYDDTADAALRQINERGYADKYRADGRPVTKVGLAFSSAERNITEWKSENTK